MTVEEVYTNGFTAKYVEWIEVGVSPYLHDTDIDFIYTSVNATREGNWTFPLSAGSGLINSVKFMLEAKLSYEHCGAFTVYVLVPDVGWFSIGEVIPTTEYAWYEFDASAYLNTWDKINNTAVYVKNQVFLAGTCYIRRLTRKVDYGVAIAPKKPLMDGFVFID